MRFGRKGQGDTSTWKWILGVTVVLISSSAALLIWQTVATGPPFPTTPEEYTTAWQTYGETAFKPEGQPWRVLSIFFFPLLVYFSLIFFAINLVFANSNIRNWGDAQKPLIVFAFAVAFIVLPFPTTFALYQILGGITYIVPFFIWIVMITMIVMVFYHARQHQQAAVGGRGAWWRKKDKKEDKDWGLRKEVDNLIDDIENKFLPECNKVIKDKDVDQVDTFIHDLAGYLERIDDLGRNIGRSKLPDYAKDSDRRRLGSEAHKLEGKLEQLKKLKGAPPIPEREKPSELEIQPERLEEMSPEELKKIEEEAERKAKEIRERGKGEEAKKIARELEDKAKEAEKIRKAKEAEKVPKEIPSSIADLHPEFRRCIDGIHDYMEDIHDRADKWKKESKAMGNLQRASQAYLNTYKKVKPIALNKEEFYKFIVFLSGGRRMVLVNWFHWLPKSLDDILNAKKQLENERDKIEDKELSKVIDTILNKLLGTETLKLFSNLREVYHNMIKEANNLKMPK